MRSRYCWAMDLAVSCPAAIRAWRSDIVASSSSNGARNQRLLVDSRADSSRLASVSASSGLPRTANAPAIAPTRTNSLRSISMHLDGKRDHRKISAGPQNCPAVLTHQLALDLFYVRRPADVANFRWHQSKSSARSSAGAEFVSAPTEIQSTPVSAIRRTVSSVIPPDASVTVR